MVKSVSIYFQMFVIVLATVFCVCLPAYTNDDASVTESAVLLADQWNQAEIENLRQLPIRDLLKDRLYLARPLLARRLAEELLRRYFDYVHFTEIVSPFDQAVEAFLHSPHLLKEFLSLWDTSKGLPRAEMKRFLRKLFRDDLLATLRISDRALFWESNIHALSQAISFVNAVWSEDSGEWYTGAYNVPVKDRELSLALVRRCQYFSPSVSGSVTGFFSKIREVIRRSLDNRIISSPMLWNLPELERDFTEFTIHFINEMEKKRDLNKEQYAAVLAYWRHFSNFNLEHYHLLERLALATRYIYFNPDFLEPVLAVLKEKSPQFLDRNSKHSLLNLLLSKDGFSRLNENWPSFFDEYLTPGDRSALEMESQHSYERKLLLLRLGLANNDDVGIMIALQLLGRLEFDSNVSSSEIVPLLVGVLERSNQADLPAEVMPWRNAQRAFALKMISESLHLALNSNESNLTIFRVMVDPQLWATLLIQLKVTETNSTVNSLKLFFSRTPAIAQHDYRDVTPQLTKLLVDTLTVQFFQPWWTGLILSNLQSLYKYANGESDQGAVERLLEYKLANSYGLRRVASQVAPALLERFYKDVISAKKQRSSASVVLALPASTLSLISFNTFESFISAFLKITNEEERVHSLVQSLDFQNDWNLDAPIPSEFLDQFELVTHYRSAGGSEMSALSPRAARMQIAQRVILPWLEIAMLRLSLNPKMAVKKGSSERKQLDAIYEWGRRYGFLDLYFSDQSAAFLAESASHPSLRQIILSNIVAHAGRLKAQCVLASTLVEMIPIVSLKERQQILGILGSVSGQIPSLEGQLQEYLSSRAARNLSGLERAEITRLMEKHRCEGALR